MAAGPDADRPGQSDFLAFQTRVQSGTVTSENHVVGAGALEASTRKSNR